MSALLGYFVLGTLAAFGLLSLLWTLLGWLLPEEKGCAVVFWGFPEPEILTKIKWLRNLGFLSCPVVVLSDGTETQLEETENCNEEELLHRLKQEWERYYGTGTGNPAGCGQRCGVSEL